MKLRNMSEKVQDWGDFVNRYTTHSSRHSSPERELDFGDMRLTPSPVSPLFSSGEKQFCRRDNIDQCVGYLNQVCEIICGVIVSLSVQTFLSIDIFS